MIWNWSSLLGSTLKPLTSSCCCAVIAFANSTQYFSPEPLLPVLAVLWVLEHSTLGSHSRGFLSISDHCWLVLKATSSLFFNFKSSERSHLLRKRRFRMQTWPQAGYHFEDSCLQVLVSGSWSTVDNAHSFIFNQPQVLSCVQPILMLLLQQRWRTRCDLISGERTRWPARLGVWDGTVTPGTPHAFRNSQNSPQPPNVWLQCFDITASVSLWDLAQHARVLPSVYCCICRQKINVWRRPIV